MAMCRRLATEEAIFAGASTGGNVVKAIELVSCIGNPFAVSFEGFQDVVG